MPKSETIRARVEPELKAEAESVLKTLGLTPTEAIRLFYRQIALCHGLPFALRIPNAETEEALRQARDGESLSEWRDLEALKRAHG